MEVDLISPPIIAENNGIVSLLNAKNYAAIFWYHNGVVIGSDISHVLATLPGTYYVQVFEGDCSLYSDTIYVSGFGIQEEIIGANIYPQPMADILTVEIMGTAQFEMLDAAGRMLISSTITDKTEINTAALPAGVYIYKLQQNGALKTGKLLK